MFRAHGGKLAGVATMRSYATADRETCLAIFDGNVPAYFAAADRADFAGFLERRPGTFLVMEEKRVVACGGWYLEEASRRAGLAWGMVERSLQAKGIGGALLLERLRQIRDDGRAEVVDLRTTQKVRGFYERFGFAAVRSTPDGFGAGLDRIEMELRL